MQGLAAWVKLNETLDDIFWDMCNLLLYDRYKQINIKVKKAFLFLTLQWLLTVIKIR